ncbi:beta strand repeat-containing protein [Microbacterium sulfonylureivorans]|uniref:beta strand repeat-containing protein n=1 Tax=Microbacterium sulfonylureivorans TaxID=2486854 RepID=UPI0013DF74CE|nr:DUF11 domain-containing protein [Microbacterium sulfonylureivorans]
MGVAVVTALIASLLVLSPLPHAAAAPGDCPPARIWVNTGGATPQMIRYLPSGVAVGPRLPLARGYGDIAWGADGTTLYAVFAQSPTVNSTLYTLDPATGAETSSLAITLDGNPLGFVSSGLSATPDGTLLLGGGSTIYEVDPVTGVAALVATLPAGVIVGGDFLQLADGDILVLGWEGVSGAYFRLHADGTLTRIGGGPTAWGAAQSGGGIYLVTGTGEMFSLDAVPTAESTAVLPTTEIINTTSIFNGATSQQDDGSCDPDPFQAYGVEKSASVATAAPGDTVTYTILINNLGSVDYAAGTADVADNLAGVLDDADIVPGSITATSGSASVSASTLTWTGALPAGATVTVTFQVVVDDPSAGTWQLDNTVTTLGAEGGCTGTCTVATPIRLRPTPAACPPSTIWANTSVAPLTLSRYATDGTPLGASVPLQRNYQDIAWQPNGAVLWGVSQTSTTAKTLYQIDPATGASTLTRPITGLPAGTMILGGSLVYTAANTLLMDLTTSRTIYSVNPATGAATAFAVLPTGVNTVGDLVPVAGGDTLVFAKTGATSLGTSVFRLSPTATWTQIGTLPMGVVGAARSSGEVYVTAANGTFLRLNGVPAVASTAPLPTTQAFATGIANTIGASSVQDAMAPAACTVETDMSYSVAKTASAAVVDAGGLVTYTVTVDNTGAVPYPADYAGFRDDLTDVLDNGTLVPGSITASAGSVDIAGNNLLWSGPLAATGAAATVTVTYQIQTANPPGGDRQLTNGVSATGVGGVCDAAATCATTTDVRSFEVTKTSSPPGPAAPGDTIAYTLTVENTGTVAFGPGEAALTDDLADVLDDATIDPATIQASGGTATLSGTTLSWAGPLGAAAGDDTVTITYEAVVLAAGSGQGDGALVNTVAPGAGGLCAVAADCVTSTDTRAFVVGKSSSAAATVAPGTTVTYTVTVTNVGSDAFADGEAAFTDDLSDVLDDATVDPASVQASAGVASLSGTTLSWDGPLASTGAGATVTITYEAVVETGDGSGDGVLVNTVAPGADGVCLSSASCETSTAIKAFSVTKTTSDPGPLRPGETTIYTLTVENTGAVAFAAGEATLSDDLSRVLDDATIDPAAISATAGAASLTGGTLTWAGPLAASGPGASVTITYPAVVRPAGTGADAVLTNTVAPGADGTCPTAADCTTVTDTESYTVRVATTSSGPVIPGSAVLYTITVDNTGSTPWSVASFLDDLTGVLDDAVIDPASVNATGGSITVDGGVLSWTGPLAATGPGSTVTVTFTATVSASGEGDGTLVSVVVPGEGGGCADEDCILDVVVGPFPPVDPTDPAAPPGPGAPGALPATGGMWPWQSLLLGIVLLGGGAAALMWVRSRTRRRA